MENIENMVPSYQPEKAIWWLRLIGWLIDAIIISVLFDYLFKFLVYDPSIENYEEMKSSIRSYFIFYNLMYIFTFIAYFLFFELIYSRTPGKFLTKTIVVDAITFDKPTFSSILIRTLARLIPFEFLSFLSKYPHGWHDKLSSTMVVPLKSGYLSQKNFKIKLPKGVSRLVISLGILLPFIYATTSLPDVNKFFSKLITGLIFYWFGAAIVLWIYEGFKEDQKLKKED